MQTERRLSLFTAGFLALAVVLATACATPSPPPAAPGPPGTFRVGPPDVLTITILPEPVIEREVVVRPDGMISVELIGDLPASGRTTEEIAADIQGRIGRFKRNAQVTVALRAARSEGITVLGEVARPSTFALNRDLRVSEALGTVGGVSLFAAKSRIRVIRSKGGETNVYLCSLSAIEKGDLRTNFLLEGGDIIFVPPTPLASVGYAMQALLFPFSSLFSFGSKVTTTVVTGGIGAAF